MEDISIILKNQRIEQNLSLEDVAEALKIRKKYLTAIEEKSFEDIPGEVYVKGYIKLYSEFLGIPLNNNVTTINKDIESPSNYVPPENKVKKSVLFSSLMLTIFIISYWDSIPQKISLSSISPNAILYNKSNS